jgi:hypothetical protein
VQSSWANTTVAVGPDGLAAVGGTVTEGSRAMLRIVEASKPFEEQFLKLGLSFEQQREK